MATAAPGRSFYVPTIDVAPYLSDPSSNASRNILEEVRAACVSTGFFQIIGHGIPKNLQNDAFKAAADFFALPYEDKVKLDAKKSIGHRGYDVLASQSYEEGVLPDLKEGFYVGSDIQPSDPLYKRFYMGPNIWPSSSSLPDDKFREPCQRYYKALHDLSLKIFELVGATLVPEVLSNPTSATSSELPSVVRDIGFSSPTPACPLRLLHYPASEGSDSVAGKPQYGASAHTDFGAITLLLQDENPGLEVLDTTGGDTSKHAWRPIDPNPDAFVVNIGDIVSKVTNGTYKSSIHRVVCKRPDRERYSIVFFLDGCLDAVLNPIPGFAATATQNGSSESTDALTVEQHMIERLTMSYGQGKKDARRNEQTVFG